MALGRLFQFCYRWCLAGGINGSDIEITINGMTVPKTTTRSQEQERTMRHSIQGSRQTREIILGDGFGMDFSGPLTVDSFGKYLMSEADGDNEINLPLCVIETKEAQITLKEMLT